ncbi:MAG: hypothetical protein JO279_11425 [Verrucomicrobia bacterium]|nr:hypothetical protein [Verrucomicrobiota bacterium]
MKLLLTGLIALSMVGYSRADGFGTGIGIGIGLGIVNKVLSGGQRQTQPRERVVHHTTVVHERRVVHEKATPAPSSSTTVIVNNNLPAQPAAQPTIVNNNLPAQPAARPTSTTVNAKISNVTNPPAQASAPALVTPTVIGTPASTQKALEEDTTVN